MNPGEIHQERHLFVSWRDPRGSIRPIGCLTRHRRGADEGYSFVYLKLAERLDGFEPLPGLPDLHQRYQSSRLFPVFANRVMPRSRPEFDALAARVDLAGDVDPFEVLARSGGRRATDRIEVFSAPERAADGSSCVLFFVRGIRHVPGGTEAADVLRPGDHLVLVNEPTNEHNPRAIVTRASDGRQVGWVPDYLVDHVHDLRELNGEEPLATVVHVNTRDVPSHLRLLCRLTAPWPEGYEPLSGPDFQLLA